MLDDRNDGRSLGLSSCQVKVSGFLQESLQEANASIRVNNDGRVLAYGFDRPGKCIELTERWYGGAGTMKEYHDGRVVRVDKLDISGNENWRYLLRGREAGSSMRTTCVGDNSEEILGNSYRFLYTYI